MLKLLANLKEVLFTRLLE